MALWNQCGYTENKKRLIRMNTINLRPYMDLKTNTDYPIWHPYSTLNKSYNNMPNIVRGEGIFLYDADEKEYMDACSGLWNVSLGYNNEMINLSIAEQLKKLAFCSLFEYTNPLALKTANKILSLFSDTMKKVFFTCTGSESIEFAIKVMNKYWDIKGKNEKKLVLSLEDSYHGTYYGSLAVSGIEQKFIKGYGVFLNNVKMIPVCEKCDSETEKGCIGCKKEIIKNLNKFIYENKNTIAGIMVEPILASKGVEIIPENYLKYLYNICLENEILFAVDEVAVGFFRTGYPFYINKLGIKPDLVCMAKGINGGYLPMGAVSVTEEICNAFLNMGEYIVHGSTQNGNLLACAACIATLEQYEKNAIGDNVFMVGDYILKELKDKLACHRNVGDIRGEGLLIGIDLVQNKKSNTYLNSKEIYFIQESLKKRGLLLYRSDIGLILLPMYITTKNEATRMVEMILDTFKNIVY